MKVRVNVKEVNYGSVVVEVDDENEVYDAVMDAYYDGRIFWDNTDLDYTESEVEED